MLRYRRYSSNCMMLMRLIPYTPDALVLAITPDDNAAPAIYEFFVKIFSTSPLEILVMRTGDTLEREALRVRHPVDLSLI
jgi:hypothetical protein